MVISGGLLLVFLVFNRFNFSGKWDCDCFLDQILLWQVRIHSASKFCAFFAFLFVHGTVIVADGIKLFHNLAAFLEQFLGHNKLFSAVFLFELLCCLLEILADLFFLRIRQLNRRSRAPLKAYQRLDILTDEFSALESVNAISTFGAISAE
jgi:hypothetical protein